MFVRPRADHMHMQGAVPPVNSFTVIQIHFHKHFFWDAACAASSAWRFASHTATIHNAAQCAAVQLQRSASFEWHAIYWRIRACVERPIQFSSEVMAIAIPVLLP
jgi:hypothetical protein